MKKFRVALSDDFRNADGTPAFPSFDLSPLDDDPRIDWDYIPVTDGRIAAADIDGFDALILLAASFDADSFPASDQLCLIARFGVGFDNVDVIACDRNNVALTITPDGVRRPVAVAVITLMLALAGRLTIKDKLTRAGPEGWAARGGHMGVGLVGLTLASVGLGNIGMEVFRLAKPFGLNFIAHDPFADPAAAAKLGVELVGLDEVFQQGDFVSINCPLNDDTEGLVNAQNIAKMKKTAFLINTSRGPIVDQAALTDALAAKEIAGAGLDVFSEEPTTANDPLFAFENVITTPHALCWTDQCFAGIGACDVQAVQAVASGKAPSGVVNRAILENQNWLDKLDFNADTYPD